MRNSHIFSCFDLKMAFCFAVINSVAAITLKTINDARAEFFRAEFFAVSRFELSQLLNSFVMLTYYLLIGNDGLLIRNITGNYECSCYCAGFYIYC